LYTHTYIHNYIHTHIQPYKHAYIQTYIHTYSHMYIHACIHTYILRRALQSQPLPQTCQYGRCVYSRRLSLGCSNGNHFPTRRFQP
jgi:aryl-phospho-beta-D-glucosidase BglC (GH1 family)